MSGLLEALQANLERNLVGIYLHGSLAMGCFNPQRSDIDLLVRIGEGISPPARREIAELLLEISGRPFPIEISFLTWGQLFPWRHPAPYEFHYSEAWRDDYICAVSSGEWRNWQGETGVDPDLAAHITVTNQRGICLVGLATIDAFPEVPPGDYLDSILGDVLSPQFGLPAVHSHAVYSVLNGCRTLAFLQGGGVLSKAEGGIWALDHLPATYHAAIQFALNAYEDQSIERFALTPAVAELAGYLQNQIMNLRDHTDLIGG